MVELITEYRKEKKDDLFLLIYEKAKSARSSKMSYFKSKGFAEHEIVEGLDEALLESIRVWDKDKSDFLTFYRNCADLRIIDVRRRTIANEERELYEPDEDFSEEGEEYYKEFVEQDVPIEEFPTVEKEIINVKERKKEQRQLFREILNETDETLRQQLLVIAGGRSANHAAQLFNMHHQTLNRKLTRLSRKYNEEWQRLSLYA